MTEINWMPPEYCFLMRVPNTTKLAVNTVANAIKYVMSLQGQGGMVLHEGRPEAGTENNVSKVQAPQKSRRRPNFPG